MTPIAYMVEVMLAEGVSHEVIVLAIRTAELPATLPATLPPKRSRKAVNQERYRENLKVKQGEGVAMAAAPQPVTKAVTKAVTPGNAVISAPLSILSSTSDSSTEVKKEKRTDVLNTEPRAKARRGTRLPDDWLPSATDRQYAGDRGLRPIEIEIEATKFRNYWTNRTDRQASKPRWDRAWENWILNVRKAPNGQDRSVIAAQDRLNSKLAEFSEPDLLGGVRREAGPSDVRLLPARRSG